MLNILKAFLSAGTGLSGIGAFIFYAVYSKWLSIEVLSKMASEQIFEIAKYSIIATFIFAVFLVLIHSLSKDKSSVTASHGGIAVKSSGRNNNIKIGK
ncbi:hypothetical protein [Vibrio fluvialis]|uniref:hypothetical protein n=1 Tax=Vibrio fluvialis TaxID=676 RepID=UPI003D7CCA4E